MRKLALAGRTLGDGKDVADACRELQVTEATYYRWRNQFGGVKADDAKRLEDLKKVKSTLKLAARGRRPGEGGVEGGRQRRVLSPERRRAAVHHSCARDGEGYPARYLDG